ncbi:hypothetical protein ACVBE9_07650 [Eionea flava]
MGIKFSYRPTALTLLAIVLVASLLFHGVLNSRVSGSAFLYIGIPFLIALMLVFSVKKIDKPSLKRRFWSLVRDAFIVMLASSAILLEGFLCVIMFMPIYFFIVLLAFIIIVIYEKHANKKNKLHIHILPILLLVSALEGIHPDLSFNRYNEVTSTQVISADIQQIKRSLMQPVDLQDKRGWFLSIFPMPYKVEAKALQAGDIHKIHYRYHRWILTNTHEGHVLLKIAEVKDDYIRTEVVEDTSYLSNYMKSHGTEIRLKPIDDNNTEVTLTIKYERLLDPSWYFGPLQAYGVKQTADYLIAKMME